MSCQTAFPPCALPVASSSASSRFDAHQQVERTAADATTTLKPAQLSKRGQSHAAKISPFWAIFDCMLQDAYCPKSNPDGVVNMAIANNSLMEAELLQFANTHRTLEPTDLTYGTSLFGSTRLFNALSHHFNAHFSPFESVRPEHIITGPGCGSLLDQLSTHLLDDGDAFLCAQPFYNGFPADAEPRAGVSVVGVRSPYGAGEGVEDEWYRGAGALAGFEDALLAEHGRVKAVLLCQPHNPIGRCYDRAAVIAYGRFCQKHDLHLVSDEIYALSTFATSDNAEPQPFVSALSIDWEAEGVHPSRISVIYSASKDTGMNGIRVGALVTQHNPDLMAAMKVTAKLNMVGSPADALFSALLTDAHFFPRFVATNRARLSASYETIKSWLQHHGIRYQPANAGHFVMVDFTPLLPTVDKDGKKITDLRDADTMLWAKALEHKVAITPGSNYAYPRPGVFRVTFSLLPQALAEGLRRLELVLGLNNDGSTSDVSSKGTWAPPALPAFAFAPFSLQKGTASEMPESSGTEASLSAGGSGSGSGIASAVPSSVEEAILGPSRPRKRARRNTTDGVAGTSSSHLLTPAQLVPELTMAQLKELSAAASSCCC
ncbi:hypothetical protein OC844_000997 [Tilletia horrida]|nr:hypothetical protein OC844_000997 [Tilletia horrida]